MPKDLWMPMWMCMRCECTCERQRTEDAHEADQLLEEHAAWIDQSIVCFYFQNQQQSYMVNRHNAQNPSSPIVIDKAGQWVENPPTPEDVSDEEAVRRLILMTTWLTCLHAHVN